MQLSIHSLSKRRLALSVVASSLLLGACSGSASDDDTAPPGGTTNEATFRPTVGIAPFPNNLFYSGTVDGTLNIPSSTPPAQAVNQLDGWSTGALVTIDFNQDIAVDIADNAVRVFHLCVNAATTAPLPQPGPDLELVAGVDFSVARSVIDPKQLVIKPLRPLRPAFDAVQQQNSCAAIGQANNATGRNGYVFFVTNALQTASGENFDSSFLYKVAQSPDPLYNGPGAPSPANPANVTDAGRAAGLTAADARTIESIRQLTNGVEAIAAGTSAQAANAGSPQPVLNSDDIIVSVLISTQSIGATFQAISATLQPQNVQLGPTGFTTADVVAGAPGIADIWSGTIELPYYSGIPSANNPTAVLTDNWCSGQLDPCGPTTFITPAPVQRGTVTVPVIMTVPNAGSGQAPSNGGQLPVVIYQHGITSNRSTLLAIADNFAARGLAAIAIDMPLHGIVPGDSAEALRIAGIERTFDVDLIDNATGAPGPDGIIDSSGAHFLNISLALVARDNTRQAVSDLLNLATTIPTLTLNDGQGTSFTIDGGTTFLGHSLGGIVGTVFLGVAPNSLVGAGTLAMPGSGIVKLLDGSAAFGGRVAAGLAAGGAFEGTTSYEQALVLLQTATDDADPINYAALAAAQHSILMIEVVGSDSSPSDLVVPNRVPNVPPNPGEIVFESGPLSGTEPLASALGLSERAIGGSGPGLLRYTGGNHSSILDPREAPTITASMQAETANFLMSNGASAP